MHQPISGFKPEMVRGIVFDLDGTLLNSLDDIANSMNSALALNNYPVHSTEAYMGFIGEGIRQLVMAAMPTTSSYSEVDTVLADMEKLYGTQWKEHCREYEGTTAMLNALQADGYPMAVLSNKPHNLTVLCTEYFFPTVDWVTIEGQMDSRPRKPDPFMLLQISQQMGLPPQQMLMVGDSHIDAFTARAADMPIASCYWGFTPALELDKLRPNLKLNQPADLVDALVL
ncbi:MAG: HAD family hydrolase [Bacteroidota bacterium]|nr:HAD family hydrolase [Bacteroidota bacterium]